MAAKVIHTKSSSIVKYELLSLAQAITLDGSIELLRIGEHFSI